MVLKTKVIYFVPIRMAIIKNTHTHTQQKITSVCKDMEKLDLHVLLV